MKRKLHHNEHRNTTQRAITDSTEMLYTAAEIQNRLSHRRSQRGVEGPRPPANEKKNIKANLVNLTLNMRYKNDKNIKFVITRFVFFKLKMHQNPFSAGAPPRTPLGELTTLPRAHSRLGRGYPLLIPLPARRLRRLELGAYGATVLRPPSTQNPGYASGCPGKKQTTPPCFLNLLK